MITLVLTTQFAGWFQERVMSSTRSPNSINAFAIDAFRLSSELHAVSERDAPGLRAAAIRKARPSYEALVQTRQSLGLSGDDACLAENMLKAIDVRLEYLWSITFRRNLRRRRRQGQDIPTMVDIDLQLPHNLLGKPSTPRWWRSYSIRPRRFTRVDLTGEPI
jgi:hypothetical protein